MIDSMNFNMSDLNPINNSVKPLEPFKIHKVILEDISEKIFKGKKDPEAEYKVIELKFTNEDGAYTHSIFYPRKEDFERRSFTGSDGQEIQSPSRVEETLYLIAQLFNALDPKAFMALQKLSAQCKSFDDCWKAIQMVSNKYKLKGKETELKLTAYLSKNNYVTTIPNCCNINKTTKEVYTSNNVFGNKLFFSDYELRKRDEYIKVMSTAPTTMEAVNAIDKVAEPESLNNLSKELDDEIDFNSLSLD